jgi:hypothetical protein
MQRTLVKHPRSPPSPVTSLAVDAIRFEEGRIMFMFMAVGEIGKLRVPPPVVSLRTAELWQHTCFEAFVAPIEGDVYYELNFAPSTAWAAYRFDSYRNGMAKAELAAPEVKSGPMPAMLHLTATVDVGPLPELVPWEDWRIGLSAVIEASDGSRSYWALAHPAGDPDFHHRDCLAADLGPAGTL